MNRKCITYIMLLGAFVLFGILIESAHSQTTQQDIENALLKKDTIKHVNVSLNEFVAMVRDKYGLNIVLDGQAIKEKDIDPASKITIELKDVSVGSALELAVRPLGLNWTIYCEAVVISTPSAIQDMRVTKIYDVTDLTDSKSDQTKPLSDEDALANLVTSTVAPDTWDFAGGSGTIQVFSAGATKVFAVRQDYRVQQQVEKLLLELQAAVKKHAPQKGTKSEAPAPKAKNNGENAESVNPKSEPANTPAPGTRGDRPEIPLMPRGL
jgi:hypothetical protein